MRHFILYLFTLSLLSVQSAWAEPRAVERGTELRPTLLNTIRPFAEQNLGAPVEFVVKELTVDGDVALGRLSAQRPGGGRIVIEETPMVVEYGENPAFIDGPEVEVFFVRNGGVWEVYEYAIGATDVWWIGFECDKFGTLLPGC